MRMTIVDDDVEVDENEENDCNSQVDDNHKPSLPCLVKCTSVLTFQLPTFVIENDIFHLFCFLFSVDKEKKSPAVSGTRVPCCRVPLCGLSSGDGARKTRGCERVVCARSSGLIRFVFEANA